MKQVLNSLYWIAKNDLDKMKKSEMSLSQRVHYEKALSSLATMKLIIDNSNIQTP